MPVTKRIIPPIFDIKLIFFLKFLENNKNFWIKYPDKTKGIARPNEYKINNITALDKVSSIDAKAKIEPKIGPMQGVHPKPKSNTDYIWKKNISWFFSIKSFFKI